MVWVLTWTRRLPKVTGEAAQERVGEVLAGHPDAGVHGDDAVRADDHRVEIEFGDLGQVVGEPGDAQQGVAQGCGAGRVLQQRRRGADGTDQVVGWRPGGTPP